MRSVTRTVILIMLIASVLSGCNFPRATTTPVEQDPNMVKTFAAQTVVAYGTSLAAGATQTPAVDQTQAVATNTPPLSITATLSPTPQATNTPEPTATSQPCDRVRFVQDITVPDGTTFAPGTAFTKTWELENTGSCTWNSSYSLVFANDGNAMDGAASKQLTTGTVAPGQKIQVSIDLKAPTTAGTYRGYWTLRNASGVVFGAGEGNKSFYVEIKVASQKYNFQENYCKAEWRSGAGVLACPGTSGDGNGFVVKVDPAKFGARDEDEPGMWLNPQATDNGEIRGIFPAVSISQGTHFKGYLGCQKDATNCDFKFQLNYKADGGSEQTFKEWSVTYSTFTNLDTDLSSLAGKSVQFILVVKANGAMNQDQAILLQPRIE